LIVLFQNTVPQIPKDLSNIKSWNLSVGAQVIKVKQNKTKKHGELNYAP
jgi:hypothetical protein